MAKMYTMGGREEILTRPKKTRQGNGKHTKYAASSRNGKPKRTRGQGKQTVSIQPEKFQLIFKT